MGNIRDGKCPGRKFPDWEVFGSEISGMGSTRVGNVQGWKMSNGLGKYPGVKNVREWEIPDYQHTLIYDILSSMSDRSLSSALL